MYYKDISFSPNWLKGGILPTIEKKKSCSSRNSSLLFNHISNHNKGATAASQKSSSLFINFYGITQEKYVQHIILIVAFHFNCACVKIISKKMKGSTFSEILLEAVLTASGYLQGVLSGKHYDSPSLPQPGKSIFLQIH